MELRQMGRFFRMLIIISGISLMVYSVGLLFGSLSFPQIIPTFTGNSVSISAEISWSSAVWLSWLMVTGKTEFILAGFWFIISNEKSST